MTSDCIDYNFLLNPWYVSSLGSVVYVSSLGSVVYVSSLGTVSCIDSTLGMYLASVQYRVLTQPLVCI